MKRRSKQRCAPRESGMLGTGWKGKLPNGPLMGAVKGYG